MTKKKLLIQTIHHKFIKLQIYFLIHSNSKNQTTYNTKEHTPKPFLLLVPFSKSIFIQLGQKTPRIHH